MAYVYDLSVQAHTCASHLSTAVALPLESVIPNFVVHKHHCINLESACAPWTGSPDRQRRSEGHRGVNVERVGNSKRWINYKEESL